MVLISHNHYAMLDGILTRIVESRALSCPNPNRTQTFPFWIAVAERSGDTALAGLSCGP